MSRIRACLTTCLVAGGLVSVPMSASAQSLESAGVVQVTDSQYAPIIQQTGHRHHSGYYSSGELAPFYSDTYCPPGDSGYRHFLGHKHSGYRFSPPVKRPIYQTPVSYNKGFSDAWTGNAAAGQQYGYRAPTVYMPTDTTQLGYYYQTVPYWQPKPGAIPPPPIPSQWHTTVGQLPYYGHHPAGIIYGTAPTAIPSGPSPTPFDGGGVPPEPTPAATSVTPTQAVSEPASLERSTSSPALLPIVSPD